MTQTLYVREEREGIQFLSPFQVLVVIDEIIPSLLQGPRIDARVLAGDRGKHHANWPRQWRRAELVDPLAIGSGHMGELVRRCWSLRRRRQRRARCFRGRFRGCTRLLFRQARLGAAERTPLANKTSGGSSHGSGDHVSELGCREEGDIAGIFQRRSKLAQKDRDGIAKHQKVALHFYPLFRENGAAAGRLGNPCN